MRPPRVAILALSFLASVFLVCRAISSSGAASPAGAPSATPPKSSLRALFSFTSPFSLFPPSAAISLTDDNSTFFPARPAAFGPPLPSKGLSGQLWIGSGFTDDSFQGSDGEGELGCSDIPGWEDGRSKVAVATSEPGLGNTKPATVPVDATGPKTDHPPKDPVVGRDTGAERRLETQAKSTNDGTDDHLHRALQQARSPSKDGSASSGSSHADIQSIQEAAEITGKIVLLSRGGCGFLEKVKWAQRRGAIALIVGDNQKGGPLIQMFARGNVDNVTIPSVFTSRTTALLLSSLMQPGSFVEDILDGHGIPMLKPQRLAKTRRAVEEKAEMSAIFAKHASKKKAETGPITEGPVRKAGMPTMRRRSWLSRLFRWGDNQGISFDGNRPPSSGRLDWVLVDNGEDGANKPTTGKSADGASKGSSEGPSDDFQIGVQDWRDPDAAETSGRSSEGSTSRSSAEDGARSGKTGPAVRRAGKPAENHSTDTNGPKGGSITPGSGEYAPEPMADPVKRRQGNSNSPSGSRRRFLSKIFSGLAEEDDEESYPVGDTQDVSAATPTADAPVPGGDETREGLWVTITPTGSASPFFDTLLVLVVSPLITLTVVYALLIIRVKIRMRRWRAPKSVVDRLPVRTYHTITASPTRSPRAPSPSTSSPTTPLLQGSSESRSPPRTATGTTAAANLPSTDDTVRTTVPASPERNSRGVSSKWKKYMGRQVECVVCLEEYVDGVSRVMSLPCGHEFHAECITPWLTTRRRTCPICKNDVVRSLARGSASSGPRYEPFREDEYDESAGEASDSYQERVPSPDPLDGDIERGTSWNQGSRGDMQANRHDVWFSAITSRLGGSSTSFSVRREGSGDD